MIDANFLVASLRGENPVISLSQSDIWHLCSLSSREKEKISLVYVHMLHKVVLARFGY